MRNSGAYNILIVDDEVRISGILSDLFRSQGYSTRTASNGAEALELISQSKPDLVVSDIQMPVMDGFELFRILDSQHPHIKHILMTSYDIDKYITLIRKYNIGNILVKGPDFSFTDVLSYVRSILTGEIFGLYRYLPDVSIHSITINSYAQAREECRRIFDSCPAAKILYLEMAIDELISNAFFHAVLKLSDVPREQWIDSYDITTSDGIRVSWGFDKEKIGVSVEDPRGNLTKTDALKWLDTKRDEKTNEEHGRGLLLVRKLIDRLIINIDPGKRTECIVIQQFDKHRANENKPLLIHEL